MRWTATSDARTQMLMLAGSRWDDVTGSDNLGRSDCAGHGVPRFKFHLAVVFRFSLLSSQLRLQRMSGQG